MKKIYLAGGFTNWQQRVIESFCGYNIKFYDPSATRFSSPVNYVPWDINAIEESDIIFTYLEESNPGGFALASEIGYAFAKGKTIIFVCETEELFMKKYWYFTYYLCGTNIFVGLETGIEQLRSYVK